MPNPENVVKHKWPKGKSGNPAGRAKGVKLWKTILRERFENGEITQEQMVDAVIAQARRGNYRAASMIMDRMDGKPKEQISVEGSLADMLLANANKRDAEK